MDIFMLFNNIKIVAFKINCKIVLKKAQRSINVDGFNIKI